MKYKDFCIRSFPRSGNCYLKYLIVRNFWGQESVEAGRVNHRPMRSVLNAKGVAYFYLWRRFEPTAKSLYRVREQFGFNTSVKYEDFITKPLCTLEKVAEPHAWKINRQTYVQEASSGRVRSWLNVPKTLYECWEEHVRLGMIAARSAKNVMLVSHEQLLDEFEVMMHAIADFLGSDQREFEDTNTRVGLSRPCDTSCKAPKKRYVRHRRIAPISVLPHNLTVVKGK